MLGRICQEYTGGIRHPKFVFAGGFGHVQRFSWNPSRFDGRNHMVPGWVPLAARDAAANRHDM